MGRDCVFVSIRRVYRLSYYRRTTTDYYFMGMSEFTGIPYQNLITPRNPALNCVQNVELQENFAIYYEK